eukprot:7393500-Pyramimonas_sp.AAC.1
MSVIGLQGSELGLQRSSPPAPSLPLLSPVSWALTWNCANGVPSDSNDCQGLSASSAPVDGATAEVSSRSGNAKARSQGRSASKRTHR